LFDDLRNIFSKIDMTQKTAFSPYVSIGYAQTYPRLFKINAKILLVLQGYRVNLRFRQNV